MEAVNCIEEIVFSFYNNDEIGNFEEKKILKDYLTIINQENNIPQS